MSKTEEDILNEEFGDLDALIAEADAELNGEEEEQDDTEEQEHDEENQDEEENSNSDSDENEDSQDEDDDFEDEDYDDSEDDEEETEEEDETNDEESEEDEFKAFEFKQGNHSVKVTSKEQMMNLIQKGADSLDVKPDALQTEKTIIEQGGVTQDDLKLLIDAKNGDANAIAKLAQQANIEAIDIPDNGDEYKPKFEPKIQSEVDFVASKILEDTELSTAFKETITGLPQSFVDTVTSNAKDLATFGDNVKSGLAQKIIPEALALSHQGKDFAQAYVEVGKRILAEEATPPKEESKTEPKKKERTMSDKEKNLRKKAKESSTNSGSKGKKKIVSEDDVWNMSDEAFQEMVDSESK